MPLLTLQLTVLPEYLFNLKSHTDWVAVWGSCQDGVLELKEAFW